MEAYDEEFMAVAAAKILLSLRNRRLRPSPEWAPRPSEEPAVASAAVEVLQPLQVWPKRRRSPPHALAKEKSKAATTWTMAAQNLGASLEYGAGAGSAASSSGEDVPRSPPRAREKPKVKVEMMAARMPERPLYYGAAAGSGPTTSGVDRARSQPRPRSSEKAQAKVAARKEAMAAPSPETPLDYAAAAGSGASSSGEDGARSPAKRKAPGAGGSGGASSGDEGCSSPSKRTRADAAAGDCAGQATAAAVKGSVAAVKVEEPKIESESSSNRDENGMLLFDLNEDLNISWED